MKKLIILFMATFVYVVSQAQWIPQNPINIPQASNLSSVHFTSATTGYIAGGNGLIKTTDGGLTWTNNLIPAANYIQTVFFAGPDTGYAAGSTSYKTTDGGVSWIALPSIPGPFPPRHGLQFIDGNTGFINEQHGPLFKTTNGGNTWTGIKSGIGLGSIQGNWFLNSDTGFVVSSKYFGGIEKTTNGGTTWAIIPHPDSADYFAVHFPTNNDGWVVGTDGSILRTSDGGNTWIKQSSGTTNRLTSVHFINSQEGVAVGLNGTIIKTKDGGANWYPQVSSTTNYFSDVHFFDASMGCAVGSSRTIRTTTTVGEWPASVNSLSKKNTLDIELYPNPAVQKLFIQSDEKINSIKITTSLGAVIFDQQIDSKKAAINTEQLSPGNYYLIVQSKSKKASRQFSVE